MILDSGPDGGDCPPVGMCRGFESCSELMTQFVDVPVLPDFPDGLADWVCQAFPNDDNQVDSFIVSLIALAVALPVTFVLETCFAIANDNEAPESWLEWVGWRKFVFGFVAHRRWNYTLGPQPVRHVRWYVRSVGAPKTETAMNLFYSAKAWLTGTLPQWTIEAHEAEEEAAAARAEADAEEEEVPHGKKYAHSNGVERNDSPHHGHGTNGHGGSNDEHADGDGSESGGSTSTSVRSARALARYKRFVMAIGLGGTFSCWAIFAWFIFTYGMLLYKLLGDEGQASFARSWGISYAVGAASEWQDILKEAIKGAIVLAVLERLLMTRHVNWLEVRAPAAGCRARHGGAYVVISSMPWSLLLPDSLHAPACGAQDHIDYLSLQALLFKQTTLGFAGQIRIFFRHTRRIAD